MPDFSAGTASVRLQPDARSFLRDMEAKLRAVRDPRFTIGVDADTAQAVADIERFRRIQQRDGLTLGLDVGLEQAQTDMTAFRVRQRRDGVVVSVDADTGTATAGIEAARKQVKRQPFGVDVQADIAEARAEIAAMRERESRKALRLKVEFDEADSAGRLDLLRRRAGGGGGGGGGGLPSAGGGGGFGGLPAGILGVGVAGVGSLPAVASGVANVAAAVQQLSGAGLIVPGAIAGVVTAVGTAKLGTMGLDEALTALDESSDGTAKSMAKLDAAMADLAPSARDVVRAVADIRPEVDALQTTVQDQLFANVGERLRRLTEQALPTLQRGLGDVAGGLNSNVTELLDTLAAPENVGTLQRILDDVAAAQNRLTAAIEPGVSAFGTLTQAGTSALSRLSGDVDSVATRFDKWINDAALDGRLDDWINNGITGLEELGDTALNLGDSFSSIAGTASGDMLRSLEDITGGWADYLNSAEGQAALNDLIAEGDEQIDSLFNTVRNLGPTFGTAFASATTTVGAFLGTLEGLTAALNFIQTSTIPGIGDSFTAVLNPIQGVRDAIDNINDDARGNAQAKLDAALKNAPDTTPLLAKPTGGVGNAAGADNRNLSIDNLGAQAAAAQRRVDELGDAVRVLPTGRVELVENTPEVIAKVDQLGLKLKRDPITGIVELQVETTAADAKMREFVSAWSKAVISPSVRVPGQGIPAGQPGAISSANPFAGLPANLSPAARSAAPPAVSAAPTFPFPLPVPSGATGGPTPAGRGPGPTGGFLAEIHSDEWVLPEHARKAVGDDTLWALTQGRSFAGGGFIDQFGNPVTPGQLPGPVGAVAPNPYGSGGIGSIANSFLSGLGGVGNGIGGLLGGAGSGIDPGATAEGGAKIIPGLWGLAQAGDDPDMLSQWGTQTGDWLGNFAAKTLLGFGTALYKGALGMVGLENSILSPDNELFSAAAQSAGFYLGDDGPFAQDQSGTKSATGTKTATAKQLREGTQKIERADQKIAEITQRISEMPADAKGSRRLALDNDLANAKADAADARADMAALQTKGSTATGGLARVAPAGMQQQTVEVADAIGAAFPQITAIGGWRAPDGYNEHSSGRAADVMIPGSDLTLGNQVSAFALQQPGVDYVIWRQATHYADGRVVPMEDRGSSTQNHFDHVHVHTAGGGSPAAGAQQDAPGATPHGPRWVQAVAGETKPVAALIKPLPPPRPNIAPPQVREKQPQPVQPRRPAVATPAPALSAPSAPAPTPAPPPPPVAVQPPPQQTPTFTPESGDSGGSVAPPGETDYSLGWVNTAIESGAATIGALADSAVAAASMGATMGLGGGMSGIGNISVGGAIQQGGKVVKDIANVISATMVGSVPGSFMTTPEAYGRTLRPDQNNPQTAMPAYGQGRGSNYFIEGVDTRNMMQELQMRENIEAQSALANHPIK